MNSISWERVIQSIDDQELARAVYGATSMLLDRDRDILVADASERSITHCLACYLAQPLVDWDVDCEYNRDKHDPKSLRSLPNLPPNRNARNVYPDIIVHHRGTNDNRLVVEVKKSTNTESDEYDHQKLRAYKQDLGYRYALFMRIAAGSEAPGIVEASWS